MVMEEEFRAESIYMHNTTHLGIRHHGSELHHAWGCSGRPQLESGVGSSPG